VKWCAYFADICSATGLSMADVTATLKSLNILTSPILRYVVFAGSIIRRPLTKFSVALFI
jgi:hypothetical protein